MGAGKKKKHQIFAVSPTAYGGALDGAGAGGIALMTEDVPHSDAYDQAVSLIEGIAGSAPDLDGDLGAQYQTLDEQATQARSLLAEADDEGMPAQLIAEAGNNLKGATQSWLGALDDDQLQQLAAQNGFEHPSLVGLHTKPGQAPALVHWLDPAYPPELPSKAHVQAKAVERYNTLLAGGAVGDMTLADVNAADAALAAAGTHPTTWVATPAELDELQAHLDELSTQAATLNYTTTDSAARAALVSDAIATENRIADAACPDLSPDELATRRAAAVTTFNHRFGVTTFPRDLVAHNPDGLDLSHAHLLNASESLAVLRHSTPPDVAESLHAKAAERQAVIDQLKQAGQVIGPATANWDAYASQTPPLTLPALSADSGQAQAAGFVGAAEAWTAAHADAKKWWNRTATASPDLAQEIGVNGGHWKPGPEPSDLTTSFRGWAKEQPLGEVKVLAANLGVTAEHLKGATRAEVQNTIASKWDPGVKAPDLAAPKLAKPKTTPATAPASTAMGAGAPTPATGPIPAQSAFSAKRTALKDKLAHHVASVTILPARRSQADVDAITLTPRKALPVGGAHTKNFYNGPGGTTWMFKPDTTSHGARAHAEAAASEILHRAGIPSVPVYTRTLGDQKGSVQPFMEGTHQIDPAPSSWSQPDVDSIVRHHVAAWAIGDHDGKPDNLLRTPGGGLVPIDQGQAFKFYGRDRLESSYHPNSSFGSAPPVFHQAYIAAKNGSLAKGVRVRPEAALPVISAFEAIPDSQYRAILADTAREGAKRKVGWYPAMRARAAKKHGVLSPSDTQVAEAFLDHACERKHRLRSDFAAFFAKEGLSNEALAAQMA